MVVINYPGIYYPALLNTRSTGADVAGAQKIFSKPAAQLSTDLLTYEAQVVLQCYWQRHLAGNLWTLSSHTSTWLFKVFNSRPKTRTVRLLCEVKAKDLASEAEAKDTISWPRGSSRPRPWPRGLHLWDRFSWILAEMFKRLYTVGHKKRDFYFFDNSDKYWPIFVIFSLLYTTMTCGIRTC